MKPKPAEATCCVCMARKQCVIKRELRYETRHYDNFSYSDQHKGWICKTCLGKLEEKQWPLEILERREG